jgi:hydrogenase maturation protease
VNTLLIACGNSLRGDDGIAHEVLRLVECGQGYQVRHVHQWVPELAEEISRFQRVVFMDADVGTSFPVSAPVGAQQTGQLLSHASSPSEIVALSSALFGFEGEATLFRIPAKDFSPGERLSGDRWEKAAEAARELHRLLNEADGPACAADAQPEDQ